MPPREQLQADGIATALHYPIPVHLQPAHADLGDPEAAGGGSAPGQEQRGNEEREATFDELALRKPGELFSFLHTV